MIKGVNGAVFKGIMGARLHRLGDEPILIVTHEGFLSLKVSEEVTAQVVEVLQASPVQLYGIIDLRQATTSFSEMLRIVAQQSSGAPATFTHPDTYVVLVGEHVLIRLFQKLMRERKFGSVTLSIFYNMDEALRAVRQRIRADAEQVS